MSDPLELGTVVEPWGTVGAIRWDGHERYYFLIDGHGVVSMVPSDVVEPAAADTEDAK